MKNIQDLLKFYAIIQQMTHIAAQASAAMASGSDPKGALAKIAAHVEAADRTAEVIGTTVSGLTAVFATTLSTAEPVVQK